jgi:2-methylcitrate dehydratase PrpD
MPLSHALAWASINSLTPRRLSLNTASEIGARVSRIAYADLSQQAVTNAKVAILDTLGVMLAGSQEKAAKCLMRVPGMAEKGPSLIFGYKLRSSALNAALVNGLSAHAIDFDDVNIALGGHPSAPMLPALLALADTAATTGQDLITAFVAGFETETRIARGVNFHHYEKGWHPTATLGIFGAAAACTRLLNLSAESTAIAIAIASSLASGIKANFGTMTKPLHVGHCARNGLFAALLAKEGFTANPLALDHSQGFFNVFNGLGNYSTDKIFSDWAQPLDIERPGLGIKLYPCCGSAHASIDGMLSLAEKYNIDPQQVDRVTAKIHARRLAHINRPDPESALDAKFSVQYCLARCLLERRVVVDHFGNEAFLDPSAKALMSRIVVEPYVNPPPDQGDHYAVHLQVTLKSGERLFLTQERPLGRRPEEPTPRERLNAKFDSCARIALDDHSSDDLRATIERLESVSSIRDSISRIAENGARSLQ